MPRGRPSPRAQQLTVRGAVLVLALLAAAPRAAAQIVMNCEGQGACSCKMSDGSGVVDISSLGLTDGVPRFPDEKDYNGVSYSYNPCFSYTVGNCEDAAVCKAPMIGGSNYDKFGTQESATWSHNGYYPIVTYTGNSGKANVELICDQSFVEPQLFNYGEINAGEVTMQIFTKCACPGVCPSVLPGGGAEGLTAGSILLIVVLVCVLVYVVGGVTYNRVARKVTGADLMPQKEFWAGVPGLVKEGCVFSWGCVRNRGNRTEYEAV